MSSLEEKFAQIHLMLTEVFIERLKDPSELKPADLNVIRQFLKDNHVDTGGKTLKPLLSMVEDLPFESEEAPVGIEPGSEAVAE